VQRKGKQGPTGVVTFAGNAHSTNLRRSVGPRQQSRLAHSDRQVMDWGSP
jgi:hypothetical protein